MHLRRLNLIRVRSFLNLFQRTDSGNSSGTSKNRTMAPFTGERYSFSIVASPRILFFKIALPDPVLK
jgi:hypothetical protein